MQRATPGVLGWDIGGVNTKVARVTAGASPAAPGEVAVRCRPFEIQRSPDALAALLRELAESVGGVPGDTHAVTMTAELSQFFRTKREGVGFVLDAVSGAFPGSVHQAFTVDGEFLSFDRARRRPLDVAASNWSATARLVARSYPDAILIDTGTTTTDIIPVAGGAVRALGRSDPERLASGELVYTGAVRTPVEAIVRSLPFREGSALVSAEGFALSGDVHLWRGTLRPEDYSVTPPDGRPATRAFAGERLARTICADREMLGDGDLDRIARVVADAQVGTIARSLRSVHGRHPAIRLAVVTGLGAFLGATAAASRGLEIVRLDETLGAAGAISAPAAAVALLCAERVTT